MKVTQYKKQNFDKCIFYWSQNLISDNNLIRERIFKYFKQAIWMNISASGSILGKKIVAVLKKLNLYHIFTPVRDQTQARYHSIKTHE